MGISRRTRTMLPSGSIMCHPDRTIGEHGMLSVSKAQDAIRFVNEALSSPRDVAEREGMGELHAALAPHLRNWIESGGEERQVVMVTAVGSLNYDCVVPSSDLDMKAVYLPSFRDLYFGKFPKFSFVTPEFDCELHPMHHFKQHVLKGNMNFFEPLYSKAALITPNLIFATTPLKKLVEMNVMQTCLATFFTAEQMHKKSAPTVPGLTPSESKQASHSLRLLTFLINLLDTGEIELVPRWPLRKPVLSLKMHQMPQQEYNELYEELHGAAKDMMFRHFTNGSDYEFTDRVHELDGTKTEEWTRLNEEVDDELMRLIKEHI